MSVVEQTEKAIAAAEHLSDMDAGAVAALRVLAVKIDGFAEENDETTEDSRTGLDNVTIPTYLKFCESLGLTPAGRAKLAEKKPEVKGGKLGRLSSVPKPA